MEEIRLELNFENEEGRNKKLTIRKPILGLTEAEVLPVMQVFVESNIFDDDGLDPYAKADTARYIRTEVDEIYVSADA